MVLVFSPAKFDALLTVARPGLGQNVQWSRATACPCRSPTSGAAQQGCPVCRGKGYFYDPPVAAWTSLAGMKVVREWANFGEFEMGDLVATIPSDSPLWGVGENDKVSFTDSSEPFSQIVMGGVDVLPFQAISIDRIAWRDPTTLGLVEGGIPAQNDDNSLTWAGNGPPVGTQYSVSGRRNPQYWCFRDLVTDRAHSGGLALPRRVVLRKFALAGM